MNDLVEDHVLINGEHCRVLLKGKNNSNNIGYFPGIGGMPSWFPMLDILAKSHKVIAPSLPGFPGGQGLDKIIEYLDWLLAIKDLVYKSDLSDGSIVIASSVSAPFLADIAAIFDIKFSKIILISPFGLFDEENPSVDIWAQRPKELDSNLCLNQRNLKSLFIRPETVEQIDWDIMIERSMETAARFLYPLGDNGIIKRLNRIMQPTLILKGDSDQIIPDSYYDSYCEFIGNNAKMRCIQNAGHLVELDQPQLTAENILDFINGSVKTQP